MGSGPNCYQTGSKIFYIPKVSKFYIMSSSLACKCVFHRPAHNAKVGDPMESNSEGLRVCLHVTETKSHPRMKLVPG